MLCIVYNASCTAGKVPATYTPPKTMKISITRTWFLSPDGSRLSDSVNSTVLGVYDCFASALGKMHDIQSRYTRLGFQVFPFLGGLSVYSHGHLIASFKFADYEDYSFPNPQPSKTMKPCYYLWILSIDGEPSRIYSLRRYAISACEKYVMRHATQALRLSEYDAEDYSDSCHRAFLSSNHYSAFGREFKITPVLFAD